jgi:hypothetical protein
LNLCYGGVTSEPELRRLELLVPRAIDRVALDLSGLGVLTEAASGPYLAAPVLAAAAGARRVVALAADTRFHRAADVQRETLAFARRVGVEVEIVQGKDPKMLADVDIVTNTGAVRPVDAATVAALKPTAVVALMWETWEFLPEQIDLGACRARGVLVLGTNEHRPPCDLRPYAGLTAVKLLFELGLEGWGTRVLLLGCQATLGAPMREALTRLGCAVTTFSREGEGGLPYTELAGHVARCGYDAVIVADHLEEGPLIEDGGPLAPALLAESNPAARVGVVSGRVDAGALTAAGVLVIPATTAPARTHSYSLAKLGPSPVLELYAAGLRVGEVAARARLQGLTIAEAARVALQDSPAMDFPGELAWA